MTHLTRLSQIIDQLKAAQSRAAKSEGDAPLPRSTAPSPDTLPHFANLRDGGNLPPEPSALRWGLLACIVIVTLGLAVSAPKIAAGIVHYTAVYGEIVHREGE